MKLIHTQSWLVSTSLLALGSLATTLQPDVAHSGDKLVYRSVAERTLHKRFVQHSEMELVDMKFTVEGPDSPEVPEIEKPELKIVDDETIEFSDETLAAGDEQPKQLKRDFTTIENSVVFEAGESDEEGNKVENESGLAGKSVTFTWNADDKAFEATWSEEKGDDALLEPMVEDADFRAWLPGKSVDEGDTWTIPASEYNNLQEPSGSMGYRPKGSTDEPKDDSTSKELHDNVKGELKATYKGTRDEDGVKVGVIALEGKLESTSEHDVEQKEGPSVKQTTELGAELEGELLWDIAGGHFYSLTCDSNQKTSTSEVRVIEFDGHSFTLTQGRSFEGKKTYRFSCSTKK